MMTSSGIAQRPTRFRHSHHYASQLHLLHLRNDYAVSDMDGALPNFGQRHTCLGFRFAVGLTHHLREVTLWSRGQTPYLHSARKPSLPWRTSRDWSGRLSSGCARNTALHRKLSRSALMPVGIARPV